jgi:dihydroxy-acid dehydratase
MAAATVNIPAIALSVGPMLNGWHKGERTGSGTIVWKARQLLAAGEIDDEGFIKLVASPRRRPASATRWAPHRR